MDGKKFAALMLIVGGMVTLGYSGFNYRREIRQFEIGAVPAPVDEARHVALPVWAGIGALVVGGLVLSLPKKT